MSDHDGQGYWAANIRLVTWLLVVWAVCSYGFGILLRDALDSMVPFGGVGLGFWFAQQGAIYVFLGLIVVYTKKMAQIDEDFGVHED